MTLYDFTVRAQDGREVSLEEYRGKVLLIVNTATGCGFTPQYTQLEEHRDESYFTAGGQTPAPCGETVFLIRGTAILCLFQCNTAKLHTAAL